MRKRMLMSVGLLTCVGCLQGCISAHSGAGMYEFTVKAGYMPDPSKNEAKTEFTYDPWPLVRAVRYLFTGQVAELPQPPATP